MGLSMAFVRWDRGGVGALVQVGVLAVACGGDSSGNVDTGESGSTTGAPTTSSDGEIADASTDDDGDGDDSTTEATTGEPDLPWDPDGPPGPAVRTLYENRARPDAPVLERVDIVGDTPTEPVELVVFDGEKELALAGDRWLEAIVRSSPPELTAYDLHADPPTAWPIEIPAENFVVHVDARDASNARWLITATNSDDRDLYVVDLDDDGPSPLWWVDGDDSLDVDVLDTPGFVRDGESVVFRESGASLTEAIWLGPASELAPPPTVVFDAPEIVNVCPDPRGHGLFVMQFEGGAYIDIRADVPAAPQPLVMLPGGRDPSWPHFAPDGSSLAMVQSDTNDDGNVAWFEIVDGVVMDAVQLSTGASAGHVSFVGDFSPDGRWLVYVTHEPGQLWVVDLADGIPGAPVLVLEDEDLVLLETWFSPDSQFLYYRGETAPNESRLRRVALDGDAPGAPETLSPTMSSIPRVVVAGDSRSVYFMALETDGGDTQAWWVDLSGDAPAPAVRLAEGIADGTRLTSDSAYALLKLPAANGASRREVVDLSSGYRFMLANGADIGFAQLQSLR
jgi:hypothetical protein